MFNRVIGSTLGIGATVFVLLLAGLGSGALTDDPPAVNPYASADDGSATAFRITEVNFADAYVQVTNVGGTAGSLEGWFLCQFPAYFGLDEAGQVEPGSSVWFTSGASNLIPGERVAIVVDAGRGIGDLQAADGEMGLYSSGSFGDSAAIVSYVEWGSSGHARAGVAEGAAIWPAEASVDPSGSATITSSVATPTSPADWQVD